MTYGFRQKKSEIRRPIFDRPDPETTLTIPSTAGKVISVGAYDSRLMTYAAFSGRGYTRDGRTVKPDLSAPGVDIMATAPGGGYTPRTGTSFAAPLSPAPQLFSCSGELLTHMILTSTAPK